MSATKADGFGNAAGGRHGIKTAGVQRCAAQQSANRQPSAGQGAMGAHSLGRVVRAGGMKTAAARGAENRRQGWRKGALIQPHKPEQRPRWQAGGRLEKQVGQFRHERAGRLCDRHQRTSVRSRDTQAD